MPDQPAEHEVTPEPVTRPDHHGQAVDQPVDDDKPKRRRKKLLRIAIVLVLLFALLIALAPTLLSTGPGTRWLVSIVNNRTPGELTVDDVNLSWFSRQTISGVAYDDSAQGLHATIGTIDASDIGLFDLMTGSRHLGKLRVSDVDLIYRQRADFEAVPTPRPQNVGTSDASFALPPGLSVELVMQDAKVSYESPGFEPVVVSLSEGELELPDLRDIVFQFEAEIRQGDRGGRASLSGQVLNLFDPEGVEQRNQAAYDLAFNIEGVPTAALDQVVSAMSESIEPGFVFALLGEGELESDATVKGTIEKLASKLSVTTPKLSVVLDQRTEGDVLIASPQSYARFELDQDAFAALFPKSGVRLIEPTRIELASLQMALPIVEKAVDWEQATASLELKAGANLAVIDERGEVLGIDQLRITGGSESIADKASFKLSTVLSAVDSDSNVTREPVAVDLVVTEPMSQARQIDFFSEALPIQLADALVGQDGRLVLWLGKTLELQADVQGKVLTDAQGNIVIDAAGSAVTEQVFSLRPEGHVSGTVAGSYSKGRFTLATPANEPIEAKLSPQAFASLMEMLSGRPGEPALTIDQSMPVYLTLRDFKRGAVSITTRQDKAGLEGFYPDPDQTTLGATIELSPASVFDPKLKKTYELRGGTLSLSAPDLRGKTTIQAELDLWVRPDAGQAGVASLLTWQTTVTDLLDTEGRVPLESEALMQQVAATGGMRLENVPSGLMDSLLNRQGDLASILGPIVQDMDAGFTYQDGQPTGATVRLNWDTENNQPVPGAWASMKPAQFDIDEQQMLTVRGGEDLELEVRVSEDFGDRWMGRLHPILFDAKSGDRPVKIKVDGKSFRFPLKGEAMLGSRVEANVDLGTIEFGNDALLGKLLEWTDRPGERAIFEPAKVALVDGKISYGQLDLAVGKVKLRLDGEVDLASGQIVDMAVRVPGDSLIRVFNELDGLIPPDDYLNIPMTGEIRKPTFDNRLIGREVARLVTAGLIEKQKDDLRDLIRKGLGGGDKPEPVPEPGDDQPKPDGDAPAPQEDPQAPDAGADPAQEAAEELIDNTLDLLLKRLNRDKDEAGQD